MFRIAKPGYIVKLHHQGGSGCNAYLKGTDVSKRMGFSKGSVRDISRMARVSCNNILRKRTNCSIGEVRVSSFRMP